MEEGTQNSTRTATGAVKEYGPILTAVSPSLIGMLIPLQIIQLIALFPFKFPIKFLGVIRLFVRFDEEDFMKYVVSDKFYDEELIFSKRFTTKNSIFSFVSIYQRCRGFKILLRFLSNFLFFMIYSKLKDMIFLEKPIK